MSHSIGFGCAAVDDALQAKEKEMEEMRRKHDALELSYQHFLRIFTPLAEPHETCQMAAKRIVMHWIVLRKSVDSKKTTNAAMYEELSQAKAETERLKETVQVECRTHCEHIGRLETELSQARTLCRQMAEAAEMLWVVLANVSEGDWKKQNQDWQEAAARWRDNFLTVFRSSRTHFPSGAAEPSPNEPEGKPK